MIDNHGKAVPLQLDQDGIWQYQNLALLDFEDGSGPCRNRITGGGVTAGIDFGLKIAALLTSETYAKAIQLYLEYDPQPPFNAGSPETAPRIVKQFLNDMFAGFDETATAAAKRARKRLAAGS